MDFKIEINNDGTASMAWDKSSDISGNVWLSLNIEQGALFNNPKFGLKTSDIRKVTDSNVKLMRERIKIALEWLISVGRAQSLSVVVERNDSDKTRIDYQVEMVQSDGVPITVNNYISIGGPSAGFTVS
jgi:hypothetical protein